MTVPAEAQEKESRLRTALAEWGYDSAIITRRSNFAWLTCGGDAVSSRVSHTSPVYLVITPAKKYAVGYVMDLPWTMESALSGLDYEGIALPTFGKTPEQMALELAGGRAAADDSFLGVADIHARIVRLHEPYTPEEMGRYRQLAAQCSEIQMQLAQWVEPGMTERHVLARMWQLYLERGIEGHYMFVGSDDRLKRFRHPVPSDKAIEKVVMLAPAVAKWGLLISTSRTICFGRPSEELRRRFDAMSTIQATLLARTEFGTPLTSLFDLIMEMFGRVGYPEERTNHFHGGPVGYWAGYAQRMQDPEEVVKPNMAFLYYLTVAGVHTEELMLVDEQGAEFVTVGAGWPTLDIAVEGRTISVPDILVRA